MQAKGRRASEGGDALRKLREKYSKPARRQTEAPLSGLSRTSSNFRSPEAAPAAAGSAERSKKSFFAEAKDVGSFVDKENAAPEAPTRQSAMPTIGRGSAGAPKAPAGGSRQSAPMSLAPSGEAERPQSSRSDDLTISQLVYDKVLEELKRSKVTLERELFALQASGRSFRDSPSKAAMAEDHQRELQHLARELAAKTADYDHLSRQNRDLEQKVSALLELVFTLQKELRHIKELNLRELGALTTPTP